MRKILLSTFLVCSFALAKAQTPTYSYALTSNLQCTPSSGPTLLAAGAKNFILDTIDRNTTGRDVCNLPKNSGLIFTDNANTIFADSTYSIEMLVTIDDLSAWVKMIDFSNGVSDAGCYLTHGKVNFYAEAVEVDNSITANTYQHIVLSRVDSTDFVTVYINGKRTLSFVDNLALAIPSTSHNTVRFLMDDTATNNTEESLARVALINFYNDALADTSVSQKYLQLVPAPLQVANSQILTTKAYPNPCVNVLHVEAKGAYKVMDIAGTIITRGLVQNNTINVETLPAGVYTLLLDGAAKPVRFVKL
ncbi:MAG: hypothetical protein RL660_2873 [Bacteroidota bacterium]